MHAPPKGECGVRNSEFGMTTGRPRGRTGIMEIIVYSPTEYLGR